MGPLWACYMYSRHTLLSKHLNNYEKKKNKAFFQGARRTIMEKGVVTLPPPGGQASSSGPLLWRMGAQFSSCQLRAISSQKQAWEEESELLREARG